MARRSYSDSWSSSSTPPELRIPLEGFFAGIFAAAAIITGVNADPLAILQETTEKTVEAINTIHPEKEYSGYLGLFSLLFFVISVVGLIEIITQIKDWRIGLVLYAGGFLFGFLMTIAVL